MESAYARTKNALSFSFQGSARGILVPGTGVEPVRSIAPRDFKSLVSASSTTPAMLPKTFQT